MIVELIFRNHVQCHLWSKYLGKHSKSNLNNLSIILNGSLYKNCKIIEKLLITREIMDLLTNYINQIKVPSQFDNVFSEECVFSYDSPVSLVS